MKPIRIADSNNDLVGYVSIEINGTVQAAMDRLEKLEAEREKLKVHLAHCAYIVHNYSAISVTYLEGNIEKMIEILIDP